ncbi:MAG: hypothetical protein U0992_02565 [Planctomycetaceae bacterium]
MSIPVMRRFMAAATLIGLLAAKNGRSMGAEAESSDDPAPDRSYPNLKLPTLGGRQFWGDVYYCGGWRIQHHVLTGHYRLLDPDDVRQAWGTEAACRNKLERVRRKGRLTADAGRVVIVVHGSSDRRSRSAGWCSPRTRVTPLKVRSSGTQVTIRDSADYLRRVVGGLTEASEINVHSTGGRLQERTRGFAGWSCWASPTRANMANIVQRNPLFKLLFGPAGQQLIEDPAGFIAGLPTPKFESRTSAPRTDDGWLIDGDDDGTVEVENTKLGGAADQATAVIDATCRFLVKGVLRDTGVPQPRWRALTDGRPLGCSGSSAWEHDAQLWSSAPGSI